VLGYRDLYLAQAAGGSPLRLTATSGISEANPAWRPGAPTRAGTSQACIAVGTSGRDVIRGTALDDLVDAGRGNDLVYGRCCTPAAKPAGGAARRVTQAGQ
jgi:hypothetical protein